MSYKYSFFCRKFSLIAIFLLFLQTAGAQNNFSKVDAWLKNNMEDLGGRAVLVIYKDGHLVYDHAENAKLTPTQVSLIKILDKQKDKSNDDLLKPFADTTKDRIASCSKWLTAALVMTFVDEGKLNINDSIGKYLPVMNKYGKGNITIWECLSHQTGIETGSMIEEIRLINNAKSMDAAVEMFAKDPMEGVSGKTFHYSSAGLQIIAAILEKISGKDFETLFQERIAQPCNMLHTDFGHEKVPIPAGSGLSTPKDYINFLSMIENNGLFNGKRILSERSIIEMQKNRFTTDTKIAFSPKETGDWQYGFGEWIMDSATGDERSAEISSPGLFGSFPWIDNNKKYGAFLFAFNIKIKGRHERYMELKKLVDEAVGSL